MFSGGMIYKYRYYSREGFMKYPVEMASCDTIHLQSFRKIRTAVQAILMFCFSNLNGYTVGITGGRELKSAPFRWAQVT
jgi:hypothetical protein